MDPTSTVTPADALCRVDQRLELAKLDLVQVAGSRFKQALGAVQLKVPLVFRERVPA